MDHRTLHHRRERYHISSCSNGRILISLIARLSTLCLIRSLQRSCLIKHCRTSLSQLNLLTLTSSRNVIRLLHEYGSSWFLVRIFRKKRPSRISILLLYLVLLQLGYNCIRGSRKRKEKRTRWTWPTLNGRTS